MSKESAFASEELHERKVKLSYTETVEESVEEFDGESGENVERTVEREVERTVEGTVYIKEFSEEDVAKRTKRLFRQKPPGSSAGRGRGGGGMGEYEIQPQNARIYDLTEGLSSWEGPLFEDGSGRPVPCNAKTKMKLKAGIADQILEHIREVNNLLDIEQEGEAPEERATSKKSQEEEYDPFAIGEDSEGELPGDEEENVVPLGRRNSHY